MRDRLSFAVIAAVAVMFAMFAASIAIATALASSDAGWGDEFAPRGLYGHVSDAVPFRGGLAICGSFYIPGAVSQQSAAWWDGSIWHALSPYRLGNEEPKLLASGDSLVYCWQTRNPVTYEMLVHFSRWNGSDWREFGYPLTGYANALAVSGLGIVMGGRSLRADSQDLGTLARWDGSAWHAIPGAPAYTVSCLIASADTLVVLGGSDPEAQGAAMWNGSSWLQMGNGRPGPCQKLCWHNGEIVAGGYRLDSQGCWLSSWDGNAWQSLSFPRYADEIVSLASCSGRLYVSSGYTDYSFLHSDGHFLDVLDGSWRLVAYMEPQLRTWGTDLAILWGLSEAGTIISTGISLWDGLAWRGLGYPSGVVSGDVNTIANMAGMPVIGGTFLSAGSAVCRVAGWSGQGWTSLMASGGGTIFKLISFGGHSHLFGDTNSAPDFISMRWRATDYVSWIRRDWSRAGASATVHDGQLFVGSQAGTDPNVMREGADCPPLNGGIASALASWSGKLFAGGDFVNVDGLPACHIVNWDSTVWQQTGEGLDDRVLALAPWGDRLVAGGRFTHSGETAVTYVAVWDGDDWQALGAGFDGEVRALAVIGDRLYAGGQFTASGDTPLAHVAYWGGTAWRPLGSGVNGAVNALTGIGADLWVGGKFTSAGGKSSMNIARWNDALVPVHLPMFAAIRESGGVLVRWQVADASASTRYQVWRDLAGQQRTQVGASVAVGRSSFCVPDPEPPVGAADYWLQEMTTDGASNWYGPAHLAAASVPSAVRLRPAAPNPFNPRTTIRFDLPAAGNARLAVYDVAGRLVKVLVDGELPVGRHEAVWDGRDAAGRGMGSGSYFARLSADGKFETVRMGLVR